jgi:hypothetical protein
VNAYIDAIRRRWRRRRMRRSSMRRRRRRRINVGGVLAFNNPLAKPRERVPRRHGEAPLG